MKKALIIIFFALCNLATSQNSGLPDSLLYYKLFPAARAVKVEATLLKHHYPAGAEYYDSFEYAVGSKKMIGTIVNETTSWRIEGEKYFLYYDSLKPETCVLEEGSYHFDKGAETYWTIGEISSDDVVVDVWDGTTPTLFKFKFEAVDSKNNDLDYERTQPFGGRAIKTEQVLKSKGKYWVEYLIKDPRRCILHPEKPVNDTADLGFKILDGRKKSTVGTIVKINKRIYFYSMINNRTDSSDFFSQFKKNETIGEKFEIWYDSLFPEIKLWKQSLPVFLGGEVTGIAKGEITEINKKFNEVSFSYEAMVKGKKKTFQKTQVILKLNETFPKLKKGQNFVVTYSPENPQRCIIDLTKPVKEKLGD